MIILVGGGRWFSDKRERLHEQRLVHKLYQLPVQNHEPERDPNGRF